VYFILLYALQFDLEVHEEPYQGTCIEALTEKLTTALTQEQKAIMNALDVSDVFAQDMPIIVRWLLWSAIAFAESAILISPMVRLATAAFTRYLWSWLVTLCATAQKHRFLCCVCLTMLKLNGGLNKRSKYKQKHPSVNPRDNREMIIGETMAKYLSICEDAAREAVILRTRRTNRERPKIGSHDTVEMSNLRIEAEV